MAGRLSDRVVIITGGARGIGKAMAVKCVSEGAAVTVADTLGDLSQETAAELNRNGQAIGVTTDVTDWSSVQAMTQATIERFGRVDVLVNNAAMLSGVARGAFDEISEAEWDRMMAVNVKGSWLCCRSVVPQMRAQGYGKIINISSDTVLSGVPGLLHYVSSKGALVAFTRSLARELGAAGITVNAIAPGFTETPAALEHGSEASERNVRDRALKRPQVPEDLVGTVVYLASGDSDFMTGQLLAVNGGYVLH
jgi:3-oxoacyl-[acyl-carrier protein] reductase